MSMRKAVREAHRDAARVVGEMSLSLEMDAARVSKIEEWIVLLRRAADGLDKSVASYRPVQEAFREELGSRAR